MLEKFGNFIVAKRWWVIIIWLIAAGLTITFLPKLSDVESNDQSSFLPSSYESVQASHIAKQYFPTSESATDIMVFSKTNGQALTPKDMNAISGIVGKLAKEKNARVAQYIVNFKQVSPDRKLLLGTVVYNGSAQDESLADIVAPLRGQLHAAFAGTPYSAKLTGQVAISADTKDSFNKALKIVSIATIVLVLILPAIVFRSPLIGLLPVGSVGLVYSMGSALLAWAAKTFNFHVSQQLSILFTVVLFGVGTDYILFMLFRYRERLRTGDHTRNAVSFALSRAGEAIFSAALVVISSFVAMFFAKFGIFSTFAPGLVIMVAVMLIAALTLVPALVAVIGEKIFWPSKAWQSESLKPTFSKQLGSIVARRPGMVTVAILVLLLALASGALSYKADFGSFSKPPAGTESADAFNEVNGSFPAGVLNPTQVYVAANQPLKPQDLQTLQLSLQNTSGVASVFLSGMSKNLHAAVITVILKDNPSSGAAVATVAGPLRDTAHHSVINGKVLVGGVTASVADVQAVTDRDLRVIFPIAALFIFIILTLLLRSIVAPLYLLISVSLGFAATLGATVYIFQKIGGDPGLIFFLPIMLYVFVVAIGTDYNILTITRLKEEIREGNAPRKAADLTIEHSSATVASAGIILAGTFASLLLAGISLLSQMGSAIAIGVCLAAFIIAPFLIPSISALLGYAVWWPGKRPSRKQN